jgi:hypothetical protein
VQQELATAIVVHLLGSEILVVAAVAAATITTTLALRLLLGRVVVLTEALASVPLFLVLLLFQHQATTVAIRLSHQTRAVAVVAAQLRQASQKHQGRPQAATVERVQPQQHLLAAQ